jgi:hypothetical protein
VPVELEEDAEALVCRFVDKDVRFAVAGRFPVLALGLDVLIDRFTGLHLGLLFGRESVEQGFLRTPAQAMMVISISAQARARARPATDDLGSFMRSPPKELSEKYSSPAFKAARRP